MLLKKTVVIDSLWLIIKQLTVAGSAFLISIIFANYLPKDVYGNFSYVVSLALILSVSTLYGLNTVITQAVARGLEGSYKEALKTKIKWGLVGSFVALCFSAFYLVSNNIELFIAFIIVALVVPIFESFNFFVNFLQGKKEFITSSKYTVVSHVIATIIIVLVIFITEELYIILLTYFGLITVFRYLFYRLTLKKYPPNNKKEEKAIYYGKHLSFIGFVTVMSAHIDRFIVFNLLGPVYLAIYTVSSVAQQQINSLYRLLQEISLPELSQTSINKINTNLYRLLVYLFLLGMLIAAVYTFIAPYLFSFIYPKYPEAILFTQLLSLVGVAYLPQMLLDSVLRSKINVMPTYILHRINIHSIFAILVLGVFTYMWGIFGVIIARITTSITRTILGLINWHDFVKLNDHSPT